jgi:hypothetical protein
VTVTRRREGNFQSKVERGCDQKVITPLSTDILPIKFPEGS